MHINTAVINHILPLLAKYEGQHVTKVPLEQLRAEILRQTGKAANFTRITPEAISRAVHDKENGKTTSFNILLTPECRQELEESSQARRNRFRHLVGQRVDQGDRIGLVLEAIRTPVCFTINFILEPESQHIYFAAIVSYYGAAINGWADRVGLHESVGAHTYPSTHYMTNEAACDYVFLLKKTFQFSII